MSTLMKNDQIHPVIQGAGKDLESLDNAVLLAQLRSTGYVVLRGFEADLARFSGFVKRNSTRLSLDPARTFHDAQGNPVAQKVDAGTAAMGLHCENGNSPFWPDLCWFYCERPPTRGSQTTVCDGVAVFEALSEKTRLAYLSQDIVYTRRVSEQLWKTYVRYGSADGDTPGDTAAAFAALLKLMNDGTQAKVTLQEDASIVYHFRTPAVHSRSAVNPSFRAFASSIFGPSYNYERPAITFADGQLLGAELLAETALACDQFTTDIDWHVRDVVVIDNRRVMHGRRQIEDVNRTIYNALSYL